MPASTMTVAGRTFTDLTSNLIVIRGQASSTNNFATLRLDNGSAGYQIPSGKTLRIQAIVIDCLAQTGSSAKVAAFGYGDTDVNFRSGSAPTNPVYCGGDATCAFGSYGANTSPTVQEFAVNFTVPQTKYPMFKLLVADDTTFTAYGYLE